MRRIFSQLFTIPSSTLLVLSIFSTASIADDQSGVNKMEKATVPPTVQDYLAGSSSSEHHQFDFLIGDWDVEAVRYAPDGVATPYRAEWSAKSVNDGRMIIDDFKAISPNGVVISSYITLRSYSPRTQRWEFAGLAAHQPAAAILEWYGAMDGDAMVLSATGVGPNGDKVKNRIRFFDISDSKFSWQSDMSFDGGKSWVKIGQLKAVRKL